MCPRTGPSSDEIAAREASATANARADEALAAARAATEQATAALVAPKDSENARRAAEEKQRKVIQAGGGLFPMPMTSAPLAFKTLMGA